MIEPAYHGYVAVIRPKLTIALSLAAASACLLTLSPAALAAPKGFSLGVSSGDVAANSAILWAKADKAGTALLQLKKKKGFARCDLHGAPKKLKAKAKKKNDLTLQLKVKGLKPGRKYQYRWCMAGGRRSAVGTFDTAPPSGSAKAIRFAVTGDQDASPLPGTTTPYWNDFGVWRRVKAEANNFNILLGDTIYSDSEVPGVGGVAGTATSVAQKRAKYRLNLEQKAWANTRGATSYYAHWDDHEFINDFARSENSFPEGDGSVEMSGETIYANGVKAFRNYNPITYSQKSGIYRTFRWGKNLQLFFLDERSFRSTSADYGGTCDNPPGSGSPDLAPTAPAANRALFSGLVPALANPAPPACLAAIDDPNRTMLGKAQLNDFEQAIKRSNATFKVIVNEVPIQQFYALPYDRWEGYAVERRELLEFLQREREERRLPDHGRPRQHGQRRPPPDPGAGRPGQHRHNGGDDRAGRHQDVRLGDQRRDGQLELGVPAASTLLQRAAADRGGHALLRPRPVQLCRGVGEQHGAHRRAQGHRRQPGPQHG